MAVLIETKEMGKKHTCNSCLAIIEVQMDPSKIFEFTTHFYLQNIKTTHFCYRISRTPMKIISKNELLNLDGNCIAVIFK